MESVGFTGVVFGIVARLWPIWLGLVVFFGLVYWYRKRLGILGQMLGNSIGIAGLLICGFWLLAAVFAHIIAPLDPRVQVAVMKNALPGAIDPENQMVFLLGGDSLARDVFSRVVYGARIVLTIAPAATLIALLVGATLGLPAGYFGGRIDSFLSFLANLVLAFPVILLFYLLVTPEIAETGLPQYIAVVLFLMPLLFLILLINSRYYVKPQLRNIVIGLIVVIGGWFYLSLVSETETRVNVLPQVLDLIHVPANILIVFVSVVFVNSPTVFRIIRGLVLDIKTRDYVSAAQTRGERPWYIMLWEILPNARGPLIVDFCLRIGYTTILLGTLGFFGLGLSPESPDWGSTINAGRKLLTIAPYPALVPALALMSLVLGLNLLADGLREESLKD